ncbi:hypothetical protein MMON_00810 [Mycolicibacterium monacense]|uniref:Uncharacterized protein n=2 Tax=Mycolicibacterium monacense TaxID=85693 RepID=A0AAD1MXT4_MYCMB|nr:hypothetical protein MMON_00810 [Mycolicibacterium monacense]
MRSSTLRQQIDDLEPLRYARAAKRAATLAKELAEKAGTDVSPAVRHLAEAPVEQIAAERMRRRSSPSKGLSSDPSRGGGSPGSTTVRSSTPLDPETERQVHESVRDSVRKSLAYTTETMQMRIAELISETMAPLTRSLQDMTKLSDAIEQSTSSLNQLTDAIRVIKSAGPARQWEESFQTQIAPIGGGITIGNVRSTPTPAGAWTISNPGLSKFIRGSTSGSPIIITREFEHGWSDLAQLLTAWEIHFPRDLLTDGPTLEKGDRLTSLDFKWSAGRQIEDGDLFVSVRGQQPWWAPLEDDDIVRVDRTGGFVLIESRHRRPRWLATVLHRQAVDTDFFRDGLILLLRIGTTADISTWASGEAPTTIEFLGLFDRPTTDKDDPNQLAIPMEPFKPPSH